MPVKEQREVGKRDGPIEAGVAKDGRGERRGFIA